MAGSESCLTRPLLFPARADRKHLGYVIEHQDVSHLRDRGSHSSQFGSYQIGLELNFHGGLIADVHIGGIHDAVEIPWDWPIFQRAIPVWGGWAWVPETNVQNPAAALDVRFDAVVVSHGER